MKDNPNPKPFRGWAVFDDAGELWPATVGRTRLISMMLLRELSLGTWKDYKKLGYTCRRVVVTAEEE